MTELLSDIETPSDAELISCVRGGDVAAYGELFSRHIEAANRLARQLARGPDADDLVSEAFAKVLQVLQGGGGPDVAFRAYLLTSVRRLHVDRIRAGQKLQTSDDMTQFDPGIPFQDTAVADFENGAAAKAFASLPERWQLVLWHLEVEGQKPADIAPLLGMSANSVSALAYRAREGLRQAFLTMHLADISAERCRWVNERLGAYVRKGLSRRDTTKVEGHLDECRRCTAMYLELTEVNSNLAGIIAPLLLGAAAAGYVGSTGTATAGGVLALVGRARDVVVGNATAATAGAVAASVAAVATAGFLFINPADKDVIVGADAPIAATSPNSAPAPELPLGQSPAAGGSDETPTAGTSDAPGAVAPIGDLVTTETPSTVPSEIPSTATTVPGALPGVGTGDVPGSGPDANPGTPEDPGTGGTPDAPSDGTGGTPDAPSDGPVVPAPTTPIPSAPTPTVPGPAAPAPSVPAPSVPSPSVPTPSVPAPSVPAPSTEVDPPPVTPPDEPSLPSADLRLGNVTVDATSGMLSIPLTNLPPGVRALTVELESTQTTFTPRTAGGCVVDASAGNKQAVCAPTLFALGAGEVAARMDAPSDYTIELPLSYPGDMVSDELTVTVTAAGHEETDASNNSYGPFEFKPDRAPTTTPEVDVAFSDLSRLSFDDVNADEKDEYHLTGTVSNVPRDLDKIYLELSGAKESSSARFGMPIGKDGSDCDWESDTRLVCDDLAKVSDDDGDGFVDFSVDLVVFLNEGDSDTATVTIAVPDGFKDINGSNDSSSVALSPDPDVPPVTEADLALSARFSAFDDKNHRADMEVTVLGAEPGTLVFTLPSAGAVEFWAIDDQEGKEGKEVSRIVSTSGTFTTTFTVVVPPGWETKTTLSVIHDELTDRNPDNNIDVRVTTSDRDDDDKGND